MPPHDHYHNHHPNHHEQQDDNRPFPASSGVRRSAQSSPDQSQPGTNNEGFDSMSNRSVESSYQDPRHHRQSSSWTSNSQFSDVVSPYSSQQRTQYPRASPNLPPLRDHLTNNYDQSYQSSAGPYSQPYGTPGIGQNGLDGGSYASDRSSYYDTTQRYGQNYSQATRPQPPPQMDYYRYAQPGIPYQTPQYGPIDYSNSSIALHHPSSPTICAEADSRNRRRRGNLPKPITDILRGWFHDHLDHPYPTEEDKQAFVARTGLSINQISNWFINARRRHLPALRQARDRGAQITSADYDSDQLRRPHHH